MEIAPFSSSVIIILTVGFFMASLLGYLTLRLGLSPVPGYLLAGYLIGPFSPGFVADLHVAEQLAEIGVILMLFNVGLHTNLLDLWSVKKVAIPGAVFQIVISASSGIILTYFLGWQLTGGVIFGIAISVASTMILVKMLTDFKLIKTREGHIAIGWLILEDIVTVIFLILIPALAIMNSDGQFSMEQMTIAIGKALLYFIFLLGIMMTIGKKYVSWALKLVLKTNSDELFTLTVLAIMFQITLGSTYFFGTSLALGAFIAGVVMGQTPVNHAVAKNSEGLKDVFAIIFFLAIGMLFNPVALIENSTLLIGTLIIVMLVKPFAAFLIVHLLKYPLKTSTMIAIALAQIGEFSFIVAEEASRIKILPDEGYDVIIAVALVSIALNPLIFKWHKHQFLES